MPTRRSASTWGWTVAAHPATRAADRDPSVYSIDPLRLGASLFDPGAPYRLRSATAWMSVRSRHPAWHFNQKIMAVKLPELANARELSPHPGKRRGEMQLDAFKRRGMAKLALVRA